MVERLMSLPGDAYKVAHILLTMADGQPLNVRSAEVAEYFGLSLRATQRVMATLVEAGILSVVVRGTYQVLARDESNVARVAPDMARNSLVYMTSKASKSLESPTPSDEGVVGASAPVTGIEVIVEEKVGRYDYETEGSDLGGVGFIGERPAAPAKKPPKPPKYRNLVPREEWTMNEVASEFRYRAAMFTPKAGAWDDPINLRGANHSGGNSLLMALKVWAGKGLTPQDAASLLEDFFADSRETAKITNAFPAYKLYLAYIQKHIDTLLAGKVTPEYIDHIEEQDISWL